jgi:hypothetical protein
MDVKGDSAKQGRRGTLASDNINVKGYGKCELWKFKLSLLSITPSKQLYRSILVPTKSLEPAMAELEGDGVPGGGVTLFYRNLRYI